MANDVVRSAWKGGTVWAQPAEHIRHRSRLATPQPKAPAEAEVGSAASADPADAGATRCNRVFCHSTHSFMVVCVCGCCSEESRGGAFSVACGVSSGPRCVRLVVD